MPRTGATPARSETSSAAASRHYSPSGRRMLAAGVLNFLARRIEQQQAER